MSDPNLMASSVPLGRAYEILEEEKPFGNYLIVRCLAYDMLGSLYLAQNTQTNQRETLFVFPSLVAQDRDFPERFASQTKKLCALKHPNLLGFTQPMLIQNSFCLIGEAFEGLNIPDHLMLLTGSHLSTSENKQATNLPPAQVTPIVEQVLAGLAYAHDQKAMHLNLNPTKILRSSFGEVKIYGCHFLAILGQELFEMLVSAGIPPLKLDPNRSFLGTTDILSPEARLRQVLEYRSDIYAVGVNTHWLLTGRKPTSPYQPPSQVTPGIEAGWDAFTLRCLQRKPDDRYASANAALSDLRNLAQLTPITLAQPLELLLAPETPAAQEDKKKGGNKPLPVKKSPAAKLPRRARKSLTRTQRLLFIGLPAVALVALVAFLYVKVETSEEEPTEVLPVLRAAPGQIPRLWLTIAPREALVKIDQIAFPVNDGELKLKISSGLHEIIIEAPPKFRAKHQTYTVQSKPDHVFINLVPNWAVVDFATAPGATITVQPEKGPAKELGVADANGALHISEDLGDGNYTFSASKEDYTTAQVENQKIELAKSYHFDLKLIPKIATIKLVTDPPGVTVRLGDKVLGTTPFTTTDIPVDTDVRLTLELQGYQTVTRRVLVRPGMTETLDLHSLSARMGDLDLNLKLAGHTPTAEEMRDAKITINGRSYPATTQHVPDQLEGPYKVTFEHPNYFPDEKDVTIAEGKTATASVDLRPRPARLVIIPNPPVPVPIAVFLNNQPLARNADGSYTLPPNLAAKVRVEAQNYAGNVRDFKPGPNEQLSWDVPMSVIAAPETEKDYSVPYLNLALKWIQPGNFTMGSPGTEIGHTASEGPATLVTVPKGFWAGAYEVTQGQYFAVMNEKPSEFGQNDPDWGNYPVEKVTWDKAVEFTQKLTEREAAAKRLPPGYEYRLPTEAEWEFIARAGTTTPFYFGDHADSALANFKGSYPPSSGLAATSANSFNGTRPVGQYQPNRWGLYDVYGNVAEWVLDAYKSNLPGGSITAPALVTGPADARRVYRGGGWSDYAVDSRSAWRDFHYGGSRPDTTSNAIGLRVLLAPVIGPTTKP